MADILVRSYSNGDLMDGVTITDEGDGAHPPEVVDVVWFEASASSAEICAALDRAKMAMLQHMNSVRG